MAASNSALLVGLGMMHPLFAHINVVKTATVVCQAYCVAVAMLMHQGCGGLQGKGRLPARSICHDGKRATVAGNSERTVLHYRLL
jgi:hypothetical protein